MDTTEYSTVTNWLGSVEQTKSFSTDTANYRDYRWTIIDSNSYVLACAQELQLLGY